MLSFKKKFKNVFSQVPHQPHRVTIFRLRSLGTCILTSFQDDSDAITHGPLIPTLHGTIAKAFVALILQDLRMDLKPQNYQFILFIIFLFGVFIHEGVSGQSCRGMKRLHPARGCL